MLVQCFTLKSGGVSYFVSFYSSLCRSSSWLGCWRVLRELAFPFGFSVQGRGPLGGGHCLAWLEGGQAVALRYHCW